MLTTLREVLHDAQNQHYAVGLFNTVNLEMAKGVLAAAEKLHSPVIIGTAEVLLPAVDLKELAPMLRALGEAAKVPVVLHFDHGLTIDRIQEAMQLGFTSVMYDCSIQTYDENLRRVTALTADAHRRGISVEAELGHVGANSSSADNTCYTEPHQASEFANATGIDALAVAIGTAHGAYKEHPKLDLNRLSEIRAKTAVPLVLHGGSGLSDDDFRNTVAHGIAKINIFTDINTAAAKAAHDTYQAGAGMTDLMPHISAAVQAEVEKKMHLFGSDHRA